MKTLVSFEQRLGTACAVAQSITSVLFTTPVRYLGDYLRWLKGRHETEREFNPHTIKSILLTRVDGLGDLVLFSSLVREVRLLWPHAHITLVVDQQFVSLVEQCPYVDEVIGFNEGAPSMHACLLGRGALISWRSNGYGSGSLILQSARGGISIRGTRLY
jgi:hypothetical protein